MSAWENVIGHDWAIQLLRTAITRDHVGHAYLFAGPRQIGKTTLALTFGQAVNCTDVDVHSRPCGRCRACTLIANRRHPDLLLVRGEVSNRGKLTLKIDQIRDLIHDLNFTPNEARFKIAIITDFEAANPNAANAFLKTLEEPPGHTIIILTASDEENLMPTITSRCRSFNLRPVPSNLIEKTLIQRWEIGNDQARLLTRLANGRLGWAIRASQNESMLTERKQQLKSLEDSLDLSRSGRISMAGDLAGKAERLPALLITWLTWWRDLLLLVTNNGNLNGSKSALQDAIVNIDQRDELLQISLTIHLDKVIDGIKRTELALWQLEHNANSQLVMENLLLSYPLKSES